MDNTLLKKLKEKQLDTVADNIGNPFQQPVNEIPSEVKDWGPTVQHEETMEEQKARMRSYIEKMAAEQNAREQNMINQQKMNAVPEVYDENGNLVQPKAMRFNQIKSKLR